MKDWTIMVYMAGDNNLSENMAAALGDIGGHFTTLSSELGQNQINLAAFFDSNSLTAPTQYIDFSDVNSENREPFRHKIEKKDLVYPKKDFGSRKVSKEDLAEGNSASAYSILNFANWCIKTQKRTARNYAIIFSGHSFGFHGTSFLRDESEGGFITLSKFRWALEQIKKNLLNDQKISILGFDSCVMSMLEIGCELKDVAQTMVASEGSLPNSGWSYAPLLKRFLPRQKNKLQSQLAGALAAPTSLKNSLQSFKLEAGILQIFDQPAKAVKAKRQKSNGVDAEHVMDLIVQDPGYVKETAKNFVVDLIERHNNLLIGGRSIDAAAWNLEKIEPVARNVNLLAKNFNKYLDLTEKIHTGIGRKGGLQDKDIEIFQELKKIILQSHYDCQTYMHEQCIDLMDFCQRLIIECKFMERGENAEIYSEFIRLAEQIILSVQECVLKSGFSGDEYQFSNGISLYFPWSNLTFSLTNFRYKNLIFCKGKSKKGADIDKPETYTGLGKDWYLFLRNYIFRVAMRQLRKTTEIKKGQKVIVKSVLDDFSKGNPIWSKSNPIWSKSNPIWSKSNPDASRSNPLWSKSNPDASRSNPDASRSNPDASRSNPDASRSNPDASRGEFGNYLFYFSRYKNFEYQWDTSGFSDEFKFEKNFDESDEAQ